jgi:multiple sugar transport system permease protein
VASILAAVFILPMLYTLVASLKPTGDIFVAPMQWIPRRINWPNFTVPFAEKNFGTYFINSIIVAVCVTISSLFFSSLAGYSLAKFDYRGRKALFIIVLITMMVPIEVTIVPLAIIVRNLGWMNSYQGLIIPLMVSPFAIFWMRQFIITLPKDYAEAGRIDGYGEFAIFLKLIVPLCQPALGALAIFTYMGNWNSLIWPMIVASKNRFRTLPVGLVNLQSLEWTPYGEIFAMSVTALIPTLIFFIILRERLIKGMAMVSIKS